MSANTKPEKTIIAVSRFEKWAWLIAFSIFGVALGYFFSRILSWLMTKDRIPFQERLTFINKFVELFQLHLGEWSNVLFSIVGLVGGLYGAKLLLRESPAISITNDNIKIANDVITIELLQDEIRDIYYDHDELVIVGCSGHELLRKSYDSKPETLKVAFKQHGYPFRTDDLYSHLFTLWQPASQHLPDHVHALLKAREIAKKNDEGEEANVMRSELAKLGVVVKDEGTKQFWRHVTLDHQLRPIK
ncbi:hypothetical protein HNO89_000556 [Sporosarcina luteola]|nr:hypothetical protein [Sporosarcina luteola]